MKLLLSLLSLIFFVFSTCTNAQQYSYSIWNNATSGTAYYGFINLDNAQFNTTNFIPDFQFSGTSLSTYNAKTAEIASFGYSQPSSGNTILLTVSIDGWAQSQPFMDFPLGNYVLTSLASDQTNGQFNLFATMVISGLSNQNAPGTFSVTKIAQSTNNYKVIDVITGTFSTSQYNWFTETFIVTYTNATGVFSNEYSQAGPITSSKKYIIYAPNYQITSNPYNMIYVPQSQKVYALLNVIPQGSQTSVPDVFFYNSKYFGFYDQFYFSQTATRSIASSFLAITSSPTKPYLYFFSQTNLPQYPSGIVLNRLFLATTGNMMNTMEYSNTIVNAWAF